MTTTVPACAEALVAGAALPVVRIGVAFVSVQNVAWKLPPDFAPLRPFTRFAVDRPVLGPGRGWWSMWCCPTSVCERSSARLPRLLLRSSRRSTNSTAPLVLGAGAIGLTPRES